MNQSVVIKTEVQIFYLEVSLDRILKIQQNLNTLSRETDGVPRSASSTITKPLVSHSGFGRAHNKH